MEQQAIQRVNLASVYTTLRRIAPAYRMLLEATELYRASELDPSHKDWCIAEELLDALKHLQTE